MLARLFSRPIEERAAPFVVHGPGVIGWTAGSTLDSLRNDAVWACEDILASEVSGLPFGAVREQGVARLPIDPTPALLSAPSGVVSADVWLYQLVISMCDDGNAFGVITAVDRRGWPTSIETLDPNIVTDREVVKGVKQAKVDRERMKCYPFGDLWHVPGKMVRAGSPFGFSPVEYAKQAINAGLAAEDFGYRFFTDGGHPASIIYADKELTPEQARGVKASYVQATRGNREPAVFGTGLKHEQVSVNPNDSQFLDLQRFTVEKVCRFLRVPPAMVYAAVSGQNITYANVTQADLNFLKHSLEGYLVRIEQAVTALLPRPQVARFNRSALLRSDPKSRYEIHEIALRTRTRAVNEVRALEDEPPFDGAEFDQPGVPPIAGAPAPADDTPEEEAP